MAIYKLNGKEVTEEEFNKEFNKGVEGSPFFLDEVTTGFSSFSGEKRDAQEILNKLKKKDHFKALRYKVKNLTPSEKIKIEEIQKDCLKQYFGIEDFTKIIKVESEEDLKRNMNIGAPTVSHTGGTVFEKLQNSSIPTYSDNMEKISRKYYKTLEDIYSGDFNKDEFTVEEDEKKGKKETEGKLHYEISWEFIEEMAKRMANNKSNKYPLYNWKKEINIQTLKDAINRHHIEVMKGNYKDDDEILGHIVSYACNSMMLWEQLKKVNG